MRNGYKSQSLSNSMKATSFRYGNVTQVTSSVDWREGRSDSHQRPRKMWQVLNNIYRSMSDSLTYYRYYQIVNLYHSLGGIILFKFVLRTLLYAYYISFPIQLM